MSTAVAIRLTQSTSTRARKQPSRTCEAIRDMFEPFDFDNGILFQSEKDRARDAVTACHNCWFLEQCRETTARALQGTDSRLGFPPEGVVQAGVLFDPESRPYSPFDPCEEDKDQLTLDLFEGSSVPKPQWTPPRAVERVSQTAVRAALGPNALERTVTRRYLDNQQRRIEAQKERNAQRPRSKKQAPIAVVTDEARMVLNAREVREAIHQGLIAGIPAWRLARNLRMGWKAVNRLANRHNLGTTNPSLD